MGLKINAAKTKLMLMGTKRGDGVLIGGEQIEEVDEFMYLKSILSKKGGTWCEAKDTAQTVPIR